ncbi:hypothetical protein K8I85_14720 [bacterium]|nr:hypothetical protein [bacterium]
MPERNRPAIPFAGLILLAVLFAAPARAQLSPGPLSHAHKDLEGVTNCLKCHGIGSATLDDKCLACHGEIGWLREAKRGLHGTEAGKQCIECHGEHRGLDFDVIHWDNGSPEKFDHRRAGWPLNGKHLELECRKCHQPKLHATVFPASFEWKGAEKSWVGLERECAVCHKDPHEGRLGNECRNCHDESDFHHITEQRFDHSTTRYPLTGAHVGVKCDKCHERRDDKLTMPQFDRCDRCHEDVHAGQTVLAGVTRDCEECHSLKYFKPSTLGVQYHATTKYPLEGKHVRVECGKCHHDESKKFGKAQFEFRPPANACTDCHEDAHHGQLAKRPDKGACETCHVVDHFTPSTFTVARHEETKFPLKQRHREVECGACHGPVRRGLPALPGENVLGKAKVALKLEKHDCDSCHMDPHRGRFGKGGEEPVKGGCVACHDQSGFQRVALDAALHAQLGFPLDGAHGAVACFECHKEMLLEDFPSTLLLLAPASVHLPFTAPKTCVECHDDVHGGQFAKRKRGNACDVCHGPDAFRPAARFDHDRDSQFPLVGAHERVACQGCHPVKTLPDGKDGALYMPVSTKCEDCHTTPPPPLKENGS